MSNLDGTTSGCFPTTQWTQIIDVMQGGSDEAALMALTQFCEQYRPAIYRFYMRRGCPPENANDYTQEFFVSKILGPWPERKSFLHQARRGENRRFRAFLSWMLWNFLKELRKKGGQRAGVNRVHVPLEEWLPMESEGEERAYERFGREFDREFALEIIQRAADKSIHSEYLAAHLRGDISQLQAAQALGISEDAFKLAYRRFRLRLAKNLREEVSKLVGPDESEIREEIKYLMSIFAGSAP